MNNTLHNGFRLLDHLAETAESLSVKVLAEHFQLPSSHVCRLLKSLTATGYVEQDPTNRKYRISLKILNLAHARLQKERLLELARPYMRSLAEKLDAAVFVTRVYQGYSLIVGTEYPPLIPMGSDTVVGTLHSPTSSACGQICAAYARETDRIALLKKIDWTQGGDFQNRPSDFEAELALIRQRGYALRDHGGQPGAVGVPLFEESCRFNGALGVMLPPERKRSKELLSSVIESTLNCGRLITFAQGAPAEGYPHYNLSARRKK